MTENKVQRWMWVAGFGLILLLTLLVLRGLSRKNRPETSREGAVSTEVTPSISPTATTDFVTPTRQPSPSATPKTKAPSSATPTLTPPTQTPTLTATPLPRPTFPMERLELNAQNLPSVQVLAEIPLPVESLLPLPEAYLVVVRTARSQIILWDMAFEDKRFVVEALPQASMIYDDETKLLYLYNAPDALLVTVWNPLTGSQVESWDPYIFQLIPIAFGPGIGIAGYPDLGEFTTIEVYPWRLMMAVASDDIDPVGTIRIQGEVACAFFFGDHFALGVVSGENVQDVPLALWKMNPFRKVRTLTVRKCGASWSRNGRVVALAVPQGVQVLDATTWQLIQGFSFDQLGQDDGSGSLPALSPNGQLLATGSGGEVRLWEVSSGRLVHTLPGGPEVAFSPDGTLLFTWAEGKPVQVWGIQP